MTRLFRLRISGKGLFFSSILALILFGLFLSGCAQQQINGFSYSLNSQGDFNLLLDVMAENEIVLLGESTHGTQEYYEIRRKISQGLIEDHGFNFIAVEGDWNSIYQLNLYVKGLSDKNSAYEILASFDRWPEWMWANKEIELLAEWLKSYNDEMPFESKVGIYGMDVYGARDSIFQVQKAIDDAYECLSLFSDDFSLYASYLAEGNRPCNEEAEQVLEFILNSDEIKRELHDAEYFYLKQNAFVVKNAELHYRAMVDPRLSSWNERVFHMNQTVDRLMNKHNGKGIVWAHNTHVGDARFTEMARANRVNIGQLLREAGESVFILGFEKYSGQVVAGEAWGSDFKIMPVPEANKNSYGYIMNQKVMDYDFIIMEHSDLPDELTMINNQRAIGVVYNPSIEYPGNYVLTDLKKRYDAVIFIKETNALRLLD